MALAELVGILAKHEVEFIIVGGMAAFLRGTPVNTVDLDVVYDRSPTNIERLLQAFDELQAIVRDDPRRLRLNESHLRSPRHWIDLRVARARVLSLDRLIQIKQRPGRPKDQAMLPLLLATLDETNRSK